MKSKIYPRPLPPLDPNQVPDVTTGMWLGRIAGALVSALIYALMAIWVVGGWFNAPPSDYFAIGLIGAGASLMFSMVYLSNVDN